MEREADAKQNENITILSFLKELNNKNNKPNQRSHEAVARIKTPQNFNQNKEISPGSEYNKDAISELSLAGSSFFENKPVSKKHEERQVNRNLPFSPRPKSVENIPLCDPNKKCCVIL